MLYNQKSIYDFKTFSISISSAIWKTVRFFAASIDPRLTVISKDLNYLIALTGLRSIFHNFKVYLSFFVIRFHIKKLLPGFVGSVVCFYLLFFHFNCHKLTKYLLVIFIGRNPKIFSISWELLHKIQLMLLKKKL